MLDIIKGVIINTRMHLERNKRDPNGISLTLCLSKMQMQWCDISVRERLNIVKEKSIALLEPCQSVPLPNLTHIFILFLALCISRVVFLTWG